MHALSESGRGCGRVLLAAALLATPAAIAAGDANVRANGRRGGNYLIITAPDYALTVPLTGFANFKADQGFEVTVHTVLRNTSNTAIKSHIEFLWHTPAAPDYILIVGDTDGLTSTSNTIPHWVGQASGGPTTDLPYACMDPGDDWHPDIYIGRFSVRDEEMLQAVVDKTVTVESGVFPDPEYAYRAAFLATDDMSSGAEETHDWVIENFMDPAGFESIRIYARLGGNTQDISDAVNNGVMFVTYGGHSGSGGWSSPGFGQGNVQALTNANMYPLVFGWSCNTAHFDYDECFGETWQRVSNRGAAAYLSASSYIPSGGWEAWEPSRQLERYFFESFFAEDIWEVGPAWQAALYDFLADYGSDPAHEDITRKFFEMMTLLGDPALLLPPGVGFSLNPDPTSLSLCSPPANEAVYAVEVEQRGGFNEPVTLSASGGPPGSSIDFSVNGLPPPYATVMTVSDIIGGSPGWYTIEITGTADTVDRSTSVDLNLSDSLPGEVVLTSPPEGAVNVPCQPTLAWRLSFQAVSYDLEIARNSGFTNIVYAATVTETTHTVDLYLEPDTLHYWHVQANNGCGGSGFSDTYSFTTVDQTNYFTEEFVGGFDLENLTVAFIPDGSSDHYRMCTEPASEFPTDPSGSTPIPLGDDSYEQIYLNADEVVQLYGVAYTDFYVGSNGYITFSAGDNDYSQSLDDHFDLPRITALFDDLNPGAGGSVSWKQLEDRAVVTNENVPEYGTSNSNSFQIEMLFNGEIRITWLGIDSPSSIAGLSEGQGVPVDFIESDLSAGSPCAYPPMAEDGSASTVVNIPLTVTLIATDDGLPEPPGLDFIIVSLAAHGQLSDPGTGLIETVPYTLVDGGDQVVYSPAEWFLGNDSFTFVANDGGDPPEGGDSNIATISIEVVLPDPELAYGFPLDSDPGWSTQGLWAFGQPLGGGSHYGDPDAGHTGSKVYGYNLAGDYTNDMPKRHLTTTAINCRYLLDTELRFWRWLGVERAPFDHAYVEVSTNGSAWTTLWENPSTTISDSEWSQMSLDISDLADGEPTVYLRWVMGPTDDGVTYPGWNIDDIEIWAAVLGPQCPGDLDGDGDVDLADLAQLLANYGMTGGAEYEDGDLDGDGDVDLADLAALLGVYGSTCD